VSQAAAIPKESWLILRDKLLHPSTLLLLATNAIPLLGVIFWHWDALLMLLLYWAETGIIGIWTMVGYLFRPGYDKDDQGRTGWWAYVARLIQVMFLCLHAGLFMAAHLFILKEVFPDLWPPGARSATGFIDQVVIATWLWIPLLAMFVFHGAMYIAARLDAETMRRFLPRLASALRSNGFAGAQTPAQQRDATTASAVRFYGRIFLMQAALLIGGFLATKLGNIAPAILIIAIKTAIELTLHLRAEAAD